MTIPQFSRRSVSFLSPAAKSGSATSINVIRDEIIRLITVHLVVVFWANAIIERPQAGRNLDSKDLPDKGVDAAGDSFKLGRAGDGMRCLSTILFQSGLGASENEN
jgi:hypothetical protein